VVQYIAPSAREDAVHDSYRNHRTPRDRFIGSPNSPTLARNLDRGYQVRTITPLPADNESRVDYIVERGSP
jgi:hypothetical protein